MKKFQIKFICPECGGKHIEEIVYSDYTSSILAGNITIESDSHPWLNYKDTIADGDTHEIKYCCRGCGKEIVTDTDGSDADSIEQDLFNWLESNKMIEEIKS